MSTATITARTRATKATASTTIPITSQRKTKSSVRRSIDVALFSFIAAIVAAYAPISGTYFFLGPQISHIGDKYYERLVSWDFAYGNGSGHPGLPGANYDALIRNAAAMVPHSVLGTVAIIIGLAQFNKTFQFKYPVIHRNLGRLYGLCSLVITASSAAFLMETIPKKDVFSGELFALVLSLLSLGNIVTMALAVLFAWGKDIGSHRELMTLNYSFMLSAPLLRVFWIVIGIAWGEAKNVVNLYSSILAAPLLIGVPILLLRSGDRYPRPASKALTSSALRLAIVAGSGLSLLFLSTKLGTKAHWMNHRPQPDFWFIVPAYAALAVLFTWQANAAHKLGDMGAYTAWTTYQNGLLAAPIFAVPMYYVCRDVMGCPEEIMGLGTAVGGLMNGLANSYLAYVIHTSKLVQGSGHVKSA